MLTQDELAENSLIELQNFCIQFWQGIAHQPLSTNQTPSTVHNQFYPNMMKKFWMILVGIAVVIVLSTVSLSSRSAVANTSLVAGAHSSPSRYAICSIVTTMPGAEDTEEFLSLLETNRHDVITDLAALRSNMMQYEAEGYGWQNIIDSPDALDPKTGSWLLGALRIAC